MTAFHCNSSFYSVCKCHFKMWNVTWLNYRSVYGAYDDIIKSIQLLIKILGLPGAEFFD